MSAATASQLAFVPAVFAQAAAPTLAPVTVTAPAPGSSTVPSVADQKRTLNQNAGAVGFVDSESYASSYAFNLRDVLKDSPGVFVENRYGQELRLSIRGSGINRAFHTRGLEILQDGVPTNLADGSGDYYQIDPLALRAIEVYRGGNGFQYGATMLGGAINFVTPSAYTAVAPNLVRVDGGSFGTYRISGQASRVFENADFIGTVTHSESQGYRDHERGQYDQVNTNFGYKLSPVLETRFYVGLYVVDQKLPGSLTLRDAIDHPRMAAASALSGDQSRETRTERIANVTSLKLDSGQLDVSTWFIHKALYHPIFQALDQDGWTYGIAPRYVGTSQLAGLRNDVIVGGRIFGGTNQALQYVNNAGSRGVQTLDSRQSASNAEAYVEDRLFVVPTVAVNVGLKAYRSERRYTDYGGLPGNTAYKSDDTTYSGINPKLGVLWQPDKNIQAFANVTRSADVPDFSDLTQTVATTTRFVPLAAQRAWTIEAGTRGQADRLAWDATLYRSWVKDQLLGFTVNPSVPATTFNADKTVLQGVELGVSYDVLRNVASASAGDRVTVSQLWNYSDYRFDGDAQYGSNRLPVIPKNVLRTTIAYAQGRGLRVAGSVDWVPSGAWVDYANTQRAPGYALLGAQASYDFAGGVSLYVEGRNLTDKRYVTDLGAITNAQVASTAVYYPGAGRSVFAGARWAL